MYGLCGFCTLCSVLNDYKNIRALLLKSSHLSSCVFKQTNKQNKKKNKRGKIKKKTV